MRKNYCSGKTAGGETAHTQKTPWAARLRGNRVCGKVLREGGDENGKDENGRGKNGGGKNGKDGNGKGGVGGDGNGKCGSAAVQKTLLSLLPIYRRNRVGQGDAFLPAFLKKDGGRHAKVKKM